MNKRAQQTQIGLLVLAAVAVIIGAAIFSGSVAPSIGTMTNTVQLRNSTFTMPAAGSSIDLTGQDLINTPVVTNATGGTAVATTNYTIAEGISPTTGLKVIRLTALAGPYASKSVNVSYTYGADGYVDDSGARVVTGLIPIFAAIAILTAVFVAVKWDDWF